MSIELKKGAILVSVNQIVVEGAVLFRNILLARLLGPEQMGMAIMLAITLRFLEMISYLAADRLLVQARDGNTSRFQSNAHGLEVIRGFLSGITLCALAYPAAIIFGYPDIAWAFSVLGLSPMLRGFIHLDYRRFQRILRFDLTLKVESLASICGLLAVWPAWILIGDYSVLVWISLIQAIAQVGFSHAYARRPYCLRFQRQYLFRMLKFGWPMLVNSLLMFGVFQGDRLIVAVSVTADQLSRFALALQLGLLPTLILARGSLSLLLPILSRQQDHKIIFQKLYQRSLLFLSLTAMVFAIGYLFFGNLVIALFFGANFVVDPAVLAWLGCALAIRIVRVGPSTAALALGDSKTLLFANMWRLGGLVIAAYAGLSGMGLSFISMAAAIGETLALIAGIFLLYRHHNMHISISVLLFIAFMVGIIGVRVISPGNLEFILIIASFLIFTCSIAYLVFRATQRLRTGISH